MKNRKVLSLSFICLSLILTVLLLFNVQPISVVFATNAVTNPGFETGDTIGWSLESGSVAIRSDEYYSGNYCIASALSGIYYVAFKLSQKLSINSSTVNNITCWYKYGMGADDLFQVNYTDGTQQNVSCPTSGWTQVSITVTSGKTLDSVILQRLANKETIIMFDDIEVDYNYIPPTTFNPGTSGNDGYTYGANTTYSIALSTGSGSVNTTDSMTFGQDKVAGTYYVYRSFLKFDTSSIPSGATISAARLCLYGKTDQSVTDFTIRLQKWTGNTPIDSGNHAAYDGTNYDDGNFGTVSFITSGYNNITLSNFTLITKGGYTLICIRSSRDISGTYPVEDGGTESEAVVVYTYDKGAGYYPLLVVTYTSVSTTPPSYDASTFGTNTTMAGSSALFYGNWSGTVYPLAGFILETNTTGVFENQTWTVIVGIYWSNKTVTLNSTIGLVISWKVYANDTNAIWNSTCYFNFTTVSANVAPTVGGLSAPSTVYAYQQVNVTVTLADANGPYDGSFGLKNCSVTFSASSIVLTWLSDNSTSMTDPNNYGALVTTYTTTVNSTSVNATWTIQLYWNSTKGSYSAAILVYDQAGLSATNSGSFTYEDDLIVAANPSVNATRADPSGTVKFSGQLYYEGTSTAPYSTSEIAVYSELNGTSKGSNSSIASDGTFQITVTTEASPLGNYTYNLYSMTDENSVTNRTASLIVDRVLFLITISDDRIDTSVNATINVSGVYETDSTPMTGSFIMNDTTYSHVTVGRWNFTVQSITDTSYGLTTFTSNSIFCIWDKALIQSGGIGSTYSHVGDSILVYYVLRYEFDLSLITDGNVLLNGSAMTYNPLVTTWERTVSSAVLGNQSWIITAINSNVYGITVINDAVGTETCLYYANLNLRTVDVDSNVLTEAVVYMNNGTTGIPVGLPAGSGYAIVGPVSWSYQTVTSSGWANWTGITNGTLQIYVKWYTLTVNNTFTLTMTADMTLDLTCLCYPFTVSSVRYWAASNATVTSDLYVASILTLHFSSPVDSYLLVSSCTYQPKYITNVTYDYSNDFLLGYLTLYHYGNCTLKLSYEGWGDLYVQKTDKLISAASLIGTNLTVSFMGSLGEIGNVYVYCGSRGGPSETGGFTTTSFIGGVLLGTYTFSSSTANLWMSWATTYAGPGYTANAPTSLVLVLDLTFPPSAQPGQVLTGVLNVTWKGFPRIYIWSMTCEGDYSKWLLLLPEGLPKELSASNQSVSMLAQLKIPTTVGFGLTEVPCVLTFSTSQGSTKVFRVMIPIRIASPANVPDILTFVFLGLIGSVIGVGLFARQRKRKNTP